MHPGILHFSEIGLADLPRVGGKNASLGEMIRHLGAAGVRVPDGFATTAQVYRDFLRADGLDARIAGRLARLDVGDVAALAAAGAEIRGWILAQPLPEALADGIRAAWRALADGREIAVAVRSSATAEDLPDASFAGQQETLLNVRGEAAVLDAVRRVFASLYNDRAIVYRAHHGFDSHDIALSAGIQRMVRSDLAASGVVFTLDTESGFRDVVFVTSSYGLGETVVQGAVNPDEFYVFKPSLTSGRRAIVSRSLGAKAIRMVLAEGGDRPLRTEETPVDLRARFSITDADVETLARHAVAIEAHYGRPMDIEWAQDGEDGAIWIVQARPETVKSREAERVMRRYELSGAGAIVASGRSVGQKIGAGRACVVPDLSAIGRVGEGDVLVTDMTDPDWEPVMKRASAIVTDRGGRTCHAAIVARELGIPAVVGCGDATERVTDGQEVTVSCAQGDIGTVYAGRLPWKVHETHLDRMPDLLVKICLNVADPERAFALAALPNAGVGLARIEFIINRMIGVHPRALIDHAMLPPELRARIAQRIAGWDDPVEFYVSRLAEGIATIAAAFFPKPVIVRLSDFKSNEYANLLGGERYEPKEENPMIGFRGAARYLAPEFRDGFALECRALKRVREEMGLGNVEVMVPFVRTVEEAAEVVKLLAANGLRRGENGLRVILMCEIPSNVLLADRFLEHCDGFSIGSNDLTQLTLGIDRDSGLVAGSFDERNDAVKALMSQVIGTCKRLGKYIGICGQAPSDHPDLARWLVAQGIDSLSLNPDSVVGTWLELARPG